MSEWISVEERIKELIPDVDKLFSLTDGRETYFRKDVRKQTEQLRKSTEALIEVCEDGRACGNCIGWKECKLPVSCMIKVYAHLVESIIGIPYEDILNKG